MPLAMPGGTIARQVLWLGWPVLVEGFLLYLVGLSDTLHVMLRGQLVATVDPRSVTPEELGGYMTGGHAAPAGAA